MRPNGLRLSDRRRRGCCSLGSGTLTLEDLLHRIARHSPECFRRTSAHESAARVKRLRCARAEKRDLRMPATQRFSLQRIEKSGADPSMHHSRINVACGNLASWRKRPKAKNPACAVNSHQPGVVCLGKCTAKLFWCLVCAPSRDKGRIPTVIQNTQLGDGSCPQASDGRPVGHNCRPNPDRSGYQRLPLRVSNGLRLSGRRVGFSRGLGVRTCIKYAHSGPACSAEESSQRPDRS
jgi:hypothetical protein